MPGSDLFLQTIDAVYASGLDAARVPHALEATSRLLGASGAGLEVIDKLAQRPVEFFSVGLPDLARVPYLEQIRRAQSTHSIRAAPTRRGRHLGPSGPGRASNGP